MDLGENMLYNIKMRSSKGGPHEKGGKHISGAERILRDDEIEDEIIRMYQRALNHEKGSVDFINDINLEIDYQYKNSKSG